MRSTGPPVRRPPARGRHDRGTRLDEANHLGEVVHLLALGPLELWHGGRQYPLGSLKERRVLAVLLYAQGDPVAVDTLVERVWDDDEVPVTAVETLHSYLSRLRTRLRRAVGDLAVLERPSPRRYRLRVRHADDVDFVRLQRLRDEARAAWQSAIDGLGQANPLTQVVQLKLDALSGA